MTSAINWSDQPLGQITDAALAARLGVGPTTVAQARRALGILGHRDRPAGKPVTAKKGGQVDQS